MNNPITDLFRLKVIAETMPNQITIKNYDDKVRDNEISHLLKAMDIEEAFESNKIDLELRLLKHEHNDLKYGLKFIS